jgi:DNA mismatch endonuclease (patch repair protein)
MNRARSRSDEFHSVPVRNSGAGSGDIVNAKTRSRIMRAVGQEDTNAELRVRGLLHALGIHYRVRNRDLPGSPDVANRSSNWAIFVNGCFWHGHKNCKKTKSTRSSRVPKTRADFWSHKLGANRSRDAKKCRELRHMGYRVLILWECDLSDPERVSDRLCRFCTGGLQECEAARR